MSATIIDFVAKKKIRDATKKTEEEGEERFVSKKKKPIVVSMYDKRDVTSQRKSDDLFRMANRLDEDPATWDEAENLYVRALAIDPMNSTACTNLGCILYQKKKYTEATALFLRAIELDPRDASAHYNLGHAHFERDTRETLTDKEKVEALEVAITWFSKVIAIDKRNAESHYFIAMAFEELARRAAAKPHWEAFLAIVKGKENQYTKIAKNYLGMA